SSRRHSSSGSCRACAASTRTSRPCSSRTRSRRGSSRSKNSSRSAAAAAPSRRRPSARCSTSRRTATIRAASIPTCSTPRMGRTSTTTARPRRRRSTSSARSRTTSATSRRRRSRSSRCNRRRRSCSSSSRRKRTPRAVTRCRPRSPSGTRFADSSAGARTPRSSMNQSLQGYATRLEALAQSHGLDYYPVQFEEVPSSFMMEIAVYGLPVRMPHWSFGVRYIYQLVQHRMGHSRLFEVVFPGNPGRAYLAGNNSLQENTLVTAHVLGHADFAKNNSLFKRSQEQVGYKIVEQAASHAREIGHAIEQHGQTRVEQVLDAALALEAHIDPFQGVRRPRYPQYIEAARPVQESGFQKRFENLPGNAEAADAPLERHRAPIPSAPERDLLWLIAEYAPELEEW